MNVFTNAKPIAATLAVFALLVFSIDSSTAQVSSVVPCPGYPGASWLRGSGQGCFYSRTTQAQCASVGGSYRSDGYCRFFPKQRDEVRSSPSTPATTPAPSPSYSNPFQALDDALGEMRRRNQAETEARMEKARREWEEQEARQEEHDRNVEAQNERNSSETAEIVERLEDDRRENRGQQAAAIDPNEANPFAEKPVYGKGSSDGRKAAAKACVQRQGLMVKEYVSRAKQCLVNTRLIASFNLEPYVEPGTDRDSWGVLTPPRWKIDGDRASPVCDLSLKVDTQYESFAECARVYLCAARAAQCTAQIVARTEGDCGETTNTCLARFPVPVDVAKGEKLPPAIRPHAYHGPSARKIHPGGISGPSGRGGGSSAPSASAK